MKKYLLGVFAVVLAISLSAFTTNNTSKKTAGTALYWYDVEDTHTIGSKLNTTVVDKAGAIGNLTPCDDSQTEFCLYGSTNPNLNNFNFGSTPPSDQMINKN